MHDPSRTPSVSNPSSVSRRTFLGAAGAAGAVLAASPVVAAPAKAPEKTPETLVSLLYDSLTPEQRGEVCFDWDHQDKSRGLLRTRISNNWHITKPTINSEFYNRDQRQMVREIFEGLIQPEWHARVDKQLQDDAGGFGKSNNIAIFGKPGQDKFELVLTGRHMTLRCDGNTTEHVAFGGPIFYGHAASGFDEKPGHPGNVYWEQALEANKVYAMLDGRQRRLAEVAKSTAEEKAGFQGPKGDFTGIPVTELSADQKEQVQKTLQKLIEPYRHSDRDEVVACLKAQGGLDNCHLSFFTDEDLGNDKVWDNWRLEGPSFVWHFRGVPHVHVWVNIADSPDVKLNA
ncbi:DUF3500 domain-containing protein [Lignipirellula cremea]|uniref:DUF3500 domain-containing protein n=1 Tax=Lignipirellula cremea TaxID=2528010 RepID=A0A518DUG2_9BACT|nr:DUF3500 domain-containing protein [Lignipirellula cremea]QDU95475.1 hypothetical protein Pla8534_32900 [Lignipirellula cremea]